MDKKADETPGPGDSGRGASEDAGSKLARRKLLKLGAYTAPAIIGTLLLSREARAQTGTCGPSTCHPTCPPVAGCDPPPH